MTAWGSPEMRRAIRGHDVEFAAAHGAVYGLPSFASPSPGDEGDSMAGVRADDVLLDVLGRRRGDASAAVVPDELSSLLLEFGRWVDTYPVPVDEVA